MEVYPAKPVDVPLVCEGGGAEEVHGVVLSCEKDTISPWLQGNPVNFVTSPSTSAVLSCCTIWEGGHCRSTCCQSQDFPTFQTIGWSAGQFGWTEIRDGIWWNRL